MAAEAATHDTLQESDNISVVTKCERSLFLPQPSSRRGLSWVAASAAMTG